MRLELDCCTPNLFVCELGGLLLERRVAVLEIFHLFEKTQIEHRQLRSQPRQGTVISSSTVLTLTELQISLETYPIVTASCGDIEQSSTPLGVPN